MGFTHRYFYVTPSGLAEIRDFLVSMGFTHRYFMPPLRGLLYPYSPIPLCKMLHQIT